MEADKKRAAKDSRKYKQRRESENITGKRRSLEGRDIAKDYPPPGDLDRRAACEHDFRLFCETYFPAAFSLAWSADHLRAIARIQECVLEGGLFALAMPRGSGKTTLFTRAAMWAMLYGHRSFVTLVAATEGAAVSLLETVKTELLYNDVLVQDHRQVCYPFVAMEGNARRSLGQLFDGKRTQIGWSNTRLIFPTMPDSVCDGVNVSGATMTTAGLTGNIRGQHRTLPSGEILRPSLVLLDDPQTRESAMSPGQCVQRLAILNGDVLGMAGPDKEIVGLAAITIIRLDDMADGLLDRKKSARWRGERCKMLNAMPTNEKLWEEYANLRSESFRQGHAGEEATAFYAAHREVMDDGAKASWPERFKPSELSAIQHAMNLYIDDPVSFAAEYQNQPLESTGDDLPTLTAAEIAAKVGGVPRGEIPTPAQHITAFIDVHDDVLYWTVAAWSPEFTGWLVDYGTWPEQRFRGVSKRAALHTLGAASPQAGREGAIRTGLDALAGKLLPKDWRRADGASMRIGRCFVDTGYLPAVVDDFCRYSTHAATLTPSRGLGITASRKPMDEYHRKAGDVFGLNWQIAKPQSGTLRVCRFDANWWKRFVHSRLVAVLGDKGCLSLYGMKPAEHQTFAEHLAAEKPVRTFGNGRWCDEWHLRPGAVDNHWLDCIVGCAVAASMQGAVLAGMAAPAKKPAKRYTREDLRRRR
ncbi:MAG TPA: terminase gpA endonuclease subunit [Phycisphaerae bacterium]|nr:terminase gpA endonuclease subunit [Phycisphaerae bacterium]